MSNIDCYRDNILSKMKMNSELEDLIDNLEYHTVFGEEGIIKINSRKFKISREVLLKTLKEIKEYNEEMIDHFLKLSFDKGKKGGKDNDNNSNT